MPVRKLYIETYGCQMNVVDSEVVAAILQQHNYQVTESLDEADLVLVNTCSIRDNAEQRVRTRIREFGRLKEKSHSFSVGVIGCMADRVIRRFRSRHRPRADRSGSEKRFKGFPQ